MSRGHFSENTLRKYEKLFRDIVLGRNTEFYSITTVCSLPQRK